MPLLKAKPGFVPPEHEGCADDPCVACRAQDALTAEDWEVVEFWTKAQDQVVNILPQGVEVLYLAPRLEGWEALCRILGIPRARRRWLIEAAHYLHELVHDRQKEPLVHLMDPADLAPLEA